MLTPEQQAKIQPVIDEFAADPDIVAFVQKTESDPLPTSQHNYSKYGAFLARISQGSKSTAFIIAEALKKAGASVEGVNWAFKLFV